MKHNMTACRVLLEQQTCYRTVRLDLTIQESCSAHRVLGLSPVRKALTLQKHQAVAGARYVSDFYYHVVYFGSTLMVYLIYGSLQKDRYVCLIEGFVNISLPHMGKSLVCEAIS